MTRISERQFVRDLAGTTLDVDDASSEPALDGMDLGQADLDGDGRIADSEEHAALFRVLDGADRDGSARTISLPELRLELTAIAEGSGSRALTRRLRPPNDDVQYLGLTPSSTVELAAIRRRARAVSLGGTRPGDESGQVNRRTYDLASPQSVRDFVGTLGLDAGQSERVARAIELADHDGRDDIARVAALWARAERGFAIPSRLVLSGHASGTGVHGEGGSVSAAALGRLAAAMPRAASRIEDLHVSACWSATEPKVAEWRGVFPRLRTVWGYDGAAPTGSAAARHLMIWERATRGREHDLSPGLAAGTSHAGGVATWSEAAGWAGSAPPQDVDTLRGRWRQQRIEADPYMRGTREVEDPHRGSLRSAYTTLMQLLGRPGLPDAERRALDAERASVVRVLFYGQSIAPRFAARYARDIEDGFASLGLQAPEFATLGRGEALEQIERLGERLDRLANPPGAAVRLHRLLVAGLRDLATEMVPDSWVGVDAR